MIRVGVAGATGYAGAELVRILAGHPNVELSVVTSRQYANQRFDRIYPALAGAVDLECAEHTVENLCERTDVVFLALPHKISMSVAPDILKNGQKVIDLSADFRFQNVDAYERHYQAHTATDLLATAVYGLCEIYRNDIRGAKLIGNPGCYPTSVLLPLVPLIQNGLVDPVSLIADSKSGVSGAGRSPSLTTLYGEVTESFKAYKVAEHRHNPEMNEVLSRAAGKSVKITFVPHLVPMSRGMLSTIYASLNNGVGGDDIRSCLERHYKDQPFIRLRSDDRLPDTRFVRGTNFCDIGFRVDKASRRLIIMSAIDNLVKGAAGQAVQNMNIMLGMDETAGLDQTPYPL